MNNFQELLSNNIYNPFIVPTLQYFKLPTTVIEFRQILNSSIFSQKIENNLEEFIQSYNITLTELVIILTICFMIFKFILNKTLLSEKTRFYNSIDDRSENYFNIKLKLIKGTIFQFLYKNVSAVKKEVDKKIYKAKKDYAISITKSYLNQTRILPEKGLEVQKIQQRLLDGFKNDEIKCNKEQLSGTRYCLTEFEEQMKEFVGNYIFHNALHFTEFPSTRQMEAEVVSMTCKLYGGDHNYAIGTQGGSESIMMGVLAHRNYYQRKKGIQKPNIIVGLSAHVAFQKACFYYNVEPIIVPLNKDNSINIKAVKKAINKNTVLIVGSNPNYACGSQDDIPALAKLALKYDVGLHVDSCLGSFVMPFAQELGVKNIKPFDFKVPGVTSISCDHHKYGMAPKGFSLCMFATEEIRQNAYFSYSEWPGGLYATAQPAGSRSSAPIAGAWFAMMYNGIEGYKNAAQQIIDAGNKVRKAITETMPELEVIGNIDTFVVAFTYKSHIKSSIYQLDNEIHSKGWSLNGLQKPNSIHICITLPTAQNIDKFIIDLKSSVDALNRDPNLHSDSTSGSVGLYGASGEIPDSTTKDKVLMSIVDCYTVLKGDYE